MSAALSSTALPGTALSSDNTPEFSRRLKVFRPEYRMLTPEEHDAVDNLKYLAASLLSVIEESSGDSRCMCLARSRLEESVMWAVKGITG